MTKKITLKEYLGSEKITIDDILMFIDEWKEQNEGLVTFWGSFIEFDNDKEFNVIDDRYIAFGLKETILDIDIPEFIRVVKEDDDEFLSW